VSTLPDPAVAGPVELQIGVDQAFDEGSAELGYAGKIRDLTPGRSPKDRIRRSLVLPVGYGSSTSIEVPAGTYLIEAVAPSGSLLEQEIEIRGDEGSLDVRLADERGGLKRRGDLAWQVMGGNAGESHRPPPSPSVLHRRAGVIFGPEMTSAPASSRRFKSVNAQLWPALLAVPAIALLLAKGGTGTGSGLGLGLGLAVAWIDASVGWLTERWVPLSLLAIFVTAALLIGTAIRPRKSAIKVIRADGLKNLGGLKPAIESRGSVAADPTTPFLLGVDAGGGIMLVLEKVRLALDGDQPPWVLSPLPSRDAGGGQRRLQVTTETMPRHLFPGAGARNFFLVARQVRGPAHMAALAVPWCSAIDERECAIDVLLGGPAAPLCTSVADPQFATLLGYMSAGRLSEAQLLARSAQQLLADKLLNPFAAAAGAYVLLAAEQVHPGQPWRSWVSNLYDWFPNLPDGAVLQGWNRLQTAQAESDFEAARNLFLEAAGRGIPIFSEGVRRLQNGLAMFEKEDPDGRVREASELVRQLALRCHPQQAFTTLRLGD
jgi:hypothetical protein